MGFYGLILYCTCLLVLPEPKSAPPKPHCAVAKPRIHKRAGPVANENQRNAVDSSSTSIMVSPTKEDPHGLPAWFKVGDIITFLGVIGSLLAFVYYPNRVKRLEMRLRFVEDQLKQLYGPLLAESITSDSMFRRVELALLHLKGDHRHYNFRELMPQDFGKHATTPMTDAERHRRLFARFISEVYLPLNNRRMQLIQHNLHLIGPYPPVSLNLFLIHAAQFASLIKVIREYALTTPPIDELNRYDDPYILMPYPMMLTAEVVAKVALLKAVQNEHRYRLGRTRFFILGEIFFRDQYFLILKKDLRDDLCRATDTRTEEDRANKQNRNPDQRAFYAPTCPLVWGPYTAIELFELRSWLINRYRPIAALGKALAAEQLFMKAMLEAQISYSSLDGTEHPLHYRVSQLFDELDVPGSKINHFWNETFDWEQLETIANADKYRLQALKPLGVHTLINIPKAPGFAYKEHRYRAMREVSPAPRKRDLFAEWLRYTRKKNSPLRRYDRAAKCVAPKDDPKAAPPS